MPWRLPLATGPKYTPLVPSSLRASHLPARMGRTGQSYFNSKAGGVAASCLYSYASDVKCPPPHPSNNWRLATVGRNRLLPEPAGLTCELDRASGTRDA